MARVTACQIQVLAAAVLPGADDQQRVSKVEPDLADPLRHGRASAAYARDVHAEALAKAGLENGAADQA